ncbi:cardioacceleratory peptide receptor-like [Saccostrea cucullata]|uniref:cardioacceleratory peptide receptor-like n=1 Tax=Saccostrea cuccullata TaxID=36930 RepID=UPI002ED268D4
MAMPLVALGCPSSTEQVIFLCLLFLFILVCNIIVLILIYMTRKKRSRMNIFIADLAIADLMVGFFFVLLDIIEKLTVEWHAGVAMCKMIRFIQGVATYGSTYALVALSIDRLDSIARPLKSMSKEKRVKGLIILQWTCAVLFATPMFKFDLVTKVIRKSEKTFCMINFPELWHWKLYLTLVAIAVFIIPAILIAICYTVIVVIIWRRSTASVVTRYNDVAQRNCTTKAFKSKKEVKFQETTVVASKSLNGQACHKIGNATGGLIPKAKIKSIKMTFVIVLAFIFCWLPYFVYDLYQLYGPFDHQRLEAVTTFIQSLAPLNSAANPVIFLIFNYKSYVKMFRHGLQNQATTVSQL